MSSADVPSWVHYMLTNIQSRWHHAFHCSQYHTRTLILKPACLSTCFPKGDIILESSRISNITYSTNALLTEDSHTTQIATGRLCRRFTSHHLTRGT